MGLTPSRAVGVVSVLAAGIATLAANFGDLTAAATSNPAVPTPTSAADDLSAQAEYITAANNDAANITVDDITVGDVTVDDITVVVDDLNSGAANSGPATDLLTRYDLDGYGSLTVDQIDGELVVSQLVPAAGITAADPDDGSADSIYAVFADASSLVEVRVVNFGGVLTPTVNRVTR